MTKYRIVQLNKQNSADYRQRIQAFDCGHEALNSYLKTQASQDSKRRIASCFVALESTETQAILGYYTLSAGAVPRIDLPTAQQKKLPRYHAIPVIRLGRLAISKNKQGLGLGAILLCNALQRAAQSEIAAYAMLVDAKDNNAAQFYSHFGFIPFNSQNLSLFLPLDTIRTA